MPYIIIICILLIFIGYLLYCLSKKHKIEKIDLEKYNAKLCELIDKKAELQTEIDVKKSSLASYDNKIRDIKIQYYDEVEKQNELYEKKVQELEQEYENKKKDFEIAREQLQKEQEEKLATTQENFAQVIVNLEKETWNEQQKLNAVLEPLKQYEKDKQEKLYYTIQTPEEYREDINFLLTNVSPKIQHPDILNKLIWNEYIKPYITDTFTRIDIKEVPGIYKLTNLDSGKAYIGKSTNVKKRITDHFKAAIGINNIAWQAVHDEILKTGFWNWSIEVIIYCDQKDLNDLEKYYIEFFKTQEFGYNKTQGG